MTDEETVTFGETKEDTKPVVETTATENETNTSGNETETDGGNKAETTSDAVEQETKPVRKADPLQRRIDELTRQRHEAQRERDEIAAKLKKYEKPEVEEGGTQPDIDALAERKAEEIVARREIQARFKNWEAAGNKEFGADEFREKSNAVANLGAADRPEFMQIITDPSVIENGHRVVAALADDPDEAARILSLSPVAMSAALVKFESKLEQPKPKPKATTKAPDPIKPISGTAKATDDPTDADSDEEWARKRNAQIAAKKTGGARF
jgi:hypothetical protein